MKFLQSNFQMCKLLRLVAVDWWTFPRPHSLDCLLVTTAAGDVWLLVDFCCGCHRHRMLPHYRSQPDVSPCFSVPSPVDGGICVVVVIVHDKGRKCYRKLFWRRKTSARVCYLIWCPIALRRLILFDVRFGWFIAAAVASSPSASAWSFFMFKVFFFRETNVQVFLFCTQYLMKRRRYYSESSTGNSCGGGEVYNIKRILRLSCTERFSTGNNSLHTVCFFCSIKTRMLMTEMRSAFMCWEFSFSLPYNI